ncbi:DM13 domain-containing protein [soil metagenome]
MKTTLLAFIIVCSGITMVTSCKKASTTFINETLTEDTAAVLKYSGDFISGPYGTVTGKAKVYLKQGNYTVALEDFTSSNGPDLKVYISKEQYPVNFIKLSNLRSVNGNQLYEVPGSTDFSVYKFVLIHCEQYNHLFGSAELR